MKMKVGKKIIWQFLKMKLSTTFENDFTESSPSILLFIDMYYIHEN